MKAYKTSSWSGNGGCVHVAIDPLDGPSDGAVWIKDEWGNECQYDFEEWRIFLAGVRNNEFDLPDSPKPVTFAELHGEIARLDAQRVEQWDRMNRQIYQLKAALRALVNASHSEYPTDMLPLWQAAEAALSGQSVEAVADGHYAVSKARGIAELVLLHPRSDCGNGCGGEA